MDKETKFLVGVMFVVLALVFGVFVGAQFEDKTKPTSSAQLTTVENVSQVVMYERDYFVFFVEQEGGNVGRLEVQNYYGSKMVRDLNPGQQTYVTFFCGRGETCKPIPNSFSRWSVITSNLVIHLHPWTEIDSAKVGYKSQAAIPTVVR